MQAPDFWRRGCGGIRSAVLVPLGWGYGLAGKVRRKVVSGWQAPVPVICIGNIVMGGAGKTPVAIDIGSRLSGRGHSVNFLSRGYGGTETGPHRVDPDLDGPDRVGDEPLLLAQVARAWVSRDRAEGARMIAEDGGDLIVMDDGFQNPGLVKTISILVIDGRYGFGNGRLFPAGPLRESIADALARAQAVAVMGPDEAGVVTQVSDIAPALPVLRAQIIPGPEIRGLRGQEVTAFAAIGEPEKFFRTLEDGGCKVIARRSFADHHPFTDREIIDLKALAAKNGSRLITTEKDMVRIPPDWRGGIETLTITLQWEDEAALNALFGRFLEAN